VMDLAEHVARFFHNYGAILAPGSPLLVALSGGCFLNRRLTERLTAALEREGFTVLRHSEVSPGDGGVALGQAEVARQRLAAGTL